MPTPGGPTKHRIDPAADWDSGPLQLPHGEELEDPVLDLLDVVVILVEHLAGVLEVEVVLGLLVPRQRRDPLEIRANDAVLGHRRLQPLEPGQLAVDLLADDLGEVERLELRAQFVDLGLDLVGLTELLLDRLELLAQEILALALVELGLDLRLDLRADRHHLKLARQDLRELSEALRDVDLLEQRLLLLGRDPQRAGDQVRQHAGVVDVGDHDLELLGQVRNLLDDVRERVLHVAHQRGQLGGVLHHVRRLGDLGDQVRLGPHPAHDPDARAALDQNAQRAVGDADHPRHHAENADVVQIVGGGRLGVGVAARHHRDRAIAPEHLVDQLDAPRLADVERDEHVRERDRVPQRQHAHLLGKLAAGAHRHIPGRAFRGADLDHEVPIMRFGS